MLNLENQRAEFNPTPCLLVRHVFTPPSNTHAHSFNVRACAPDAYRNVQLEVQMEGERG